MTQSLLIKYAEIGIKGKNRYLFENALVKQAKIALKRVDGEFIVTKKQEEFMLLQNLTAIWMKQLKHYNMCLVL